MRIVLMGTPEFAVGILDHLNQTSHNVVGVVTVADKPAGRGKKLHQSAVKKYALDNDLNLLQPVNLKSQDFIDELINLKPDIIVVVAFRMLPKAVWEIPTYGTINLHASLLPAYRGAAPINWAIINGDKTTGVSTFFIDDAIDTGAVLLQKSVPISDTETAGSLHDKLMDTGKILVKDTLDGIEDKSLKAKPQPDIGISKAPKLTKDNTKIDWNANPDTIINLIRGLSPYPVAWTHVSTNDAPNKPNRVKIYKASFKEADHNLSIGSITSDKNTMRIAVKNGWVYIEELQYPGKRKMPIKDFLNGFTFDKKSYCL